MMIEDNLLPSKSKNLKSSKLSKNNKRCMELDEEYNNLQNHPTSILSFDAYGNLTSSDDPNVSFSHDLPSMEEFDFIIEGFEASFNPPPSKNKKCVESTPVLNKPTSSKKTSHNANSLESSVSHDNMKQAFNPEVNISATSRYGRTRKQKVAGDDFLVGNINFKELRKFSSLIKNKHISENKSESVVVIDSLESLSNITSQRKNCHDSEKKSDSESEVIVNAIESTLSSPKDKSNSKNSSYSEVIVDSLESTITSKINEHNSKNRSDSEVIVNSLKPMQGSWQITPKFEVIANSIPNFSSEDEFEPEKVIFKESNFKKSANKQLQSVSIDLGIKNKVKKPEIINIIEKPINKAERRKVYKMKKCKNEENNFLLKENTVIKVHNDNISVEKRTSPRHKRKCENSEPAHKRNTRRNNCSFFSDQIENCSSIIDVKVKVSNHLVNDEEDADKLDCSKIAIITNSSELPLNIKEEKHVLQYSSSITLDSDVGTCLSSFESVNSLNDIEQDLKILKSCLNDTGIIKENGSNHAQISLQPTMSSSSVISYNYSIHPQTLNTSNDKKLEIIKIETLLGEIDVKDAESPSLSKFGRHVKKSELINKSPNENVEKKHKSMMNSDISAYKEDLFMMEDIDETEVEKILPFEYIVGDLVWVAVGGSPLWPGLVTNPKDSSNYTKVIINNCKNIQQVKGKGGRAYHIQFLCDNFQVSWSRPSAIYPFEGLPKLVKYLDDSRNELKRSFGKKALNNLMKCCLKTLHVLNKKSLSRKFERWHEAITTAESLMCLKRDQRLQKFITDEEDEKKKCKKEKKLHRLPKKSENNNNENEEEFSGFVKGPSIQDLKVKRQKLSDKLNDVDFDVYFKKQFHRLQIKNPDISKFKARKILICRWNKLTVSQQLKYKASYIENSLLLETSDSSSESSNHSSTKIKKGTVNESDLDESSKGTYKLVRNEKVCFRCETVSHIAGGGDMVKCKGPCCGTFHMQCVLLGKDFVGEFKCSTCLSGVYECFICKLNDGEKVKCSMNSCGKFYHENCVKVWPQISKGRHTEKFVCPRHVCHMCAANADDMNDAAARTAPFTRCLRCPTTYHTGEICIAAGSEEISLGYHICTKHMKIPKNNNHHLNVNWCFCCSKGGSLLLCDQCPAAFHAECMNITAPEGSYICEDCENGKFPVYGDIVWVKLGQFRWWPGQVLHPRYIPDNIENLSHVQGMFCVHFFGSDDYYWVSRGRAFHYQEGDQGSKGCSSKLTEQKFQLALDIALKEYLKQNEKRKQQEESRSLKGKIKPVPWVKIDTNKPVGNVKLSKLDPSTATKCDCDPYAEAPCGSDEKCINRMLMVECIRDVCPAGDRCQNQRFQKRQYPNVYPFKTSERGWGLRTKEFINKGSFVIEYVGELIDDAEFRRRIVEMHKCKEENYYFLTVETDRMIDAGPKGNLARFMNHSCEPNCETQKWTVGDETRVGLFALEDIAPDSEVTFNYNLECVGTDKKPCQCGASRCSGFIGAKVQKSGVKKLKLEKKKMKRKSKLKDTENECFRCGNPGDLILCDKVACPKGYHLECLSLPSLPKGKWWCPWHHCDECGARVISSCIMCPNSYCKAHSSEKFYSTAGLENVCLEHAEDEFEALRGQMEIAAAVHDQKNHPENKVQKRSPDKRQKRSPDKRQKRSPDKRQKRSPEKRHPSPATSESIKKEKGFKSPRKTETPELKQQNNSHKMRGRKRKYPHTENFSESYPNCESKKIKLSTKTEIETKKRILKSLTNNVVPSDLKNNSVARISPKKRDVTAIDSTS